MENAHPGWQSTEKGTLNIVKWLDKLQHLQVVVMRTKLSKP